MIKFKPIIPPKGAFEKQVQEALEKQIRDLEKKYQRKVSTMKCPEHQKTARVEFSGSSSAFEIRACCSDFEQQVKRAIVA